MTRTFQAAPNCTPRCSGDRTAASHACLTVGNRGALPGRLPARKSGPPAVSREGNTQAPAPPSEGPEAWGPEQGLACCLLPALGLKSHVQGGAAQTVTSLPGPGERTAAPSAGARSRCGRTGPVQWGTVRSQGLWAAPAMPLLLSVPAWSSLLPRRSCRLLLGNMLRLYFWLLVTVGGRGMRGVTASRPSPRVLAHARGLCSCFRDHPLPAPQHPGSSVASELTAPHPPRLRAFVSCRFVRVPVPEAPSTSLFWGVLTFPGASAS